MAVLGLRFCAMAFSSCGKRGPLFIVVRGPLTVVASPVGSTGSRRTGSEIVAHGPSCSAACGIFPDQGSNLCPLHWQADSQPLRHQGSPWTFSYCVWYSLISLLCMGLNLKNLLCLSLSTFLWSENSFFFQSDKFSCIISMDIASPSYSISSPPETLLYVYEVFQFYALCLWTYLCCFGSLLYAFSMYFRLIIKTIL